LAIRIGLCKHVFCGYQVIISKVLQKCFSSKVDLFWTSSFFLNLKWTYEKLKKEWMCHLDMDWTKVMKPILLVFLILLVFAKTSYGHRKVILRSSYVHLLITLWSSYWSYLHLIIDHLMINLQSYSSNHMILQSSYNQHLIIIWSSYNHLMIILQSPLIILWSPYFYLIIILR
jgi:hypothetical protein